MLLPHSILLKGHASNQLSGFATIPCFQSNAACGNGDVRGLREKGRFPPPNHEMSLTRFFTKGRVRTKDALHEP